MMKKRGVSTVVATVLVLLLTVSAGAILFGIVVPFVRDSLDDSSKCKGYEDIFIFSEALNNGNCFDSSKIYFSIENKAGDELEKNKVSASITFLTDRGSKAFDVSSVDVENLKIPDDAKYQLPMNRGTYKYEIENNNFEENELIKSAEIRTIVDKKVCERISDTIEFKECVVI